MTAIKRFLRTTLIVAVIVIGGAIAYAFSGFYDISVGSGHTAVTGWFLETLRERSIERRAADIQVPPLDDPAMVAEGARVYDQTCAGCHGRPGRPPSESWEPAPPALTRGRPDPAETFWVVRNGIKMSAMPAIGAERLSDQQLWAAIAFLQTASSLTEGEYRELVEPPEPGPDQAPETEPAEPEAAPGAGNDAESVPGDEAANAAEDEGGAEGATDETGENDSGPGGH